MLLSHGLDFPGAKLILRETSCNQRLCSCAEVVSLSLEVMNNIYYIHYCQGTGLCSPLVKHITEIHPHWYKLYNYLGQNSPHFYTSSSPKTRFSVADRCQGFIWKG